MATATSSLLLDEYFANQDSRFLETLRATHQPGALISLAERWKGDARPWARARLAEYLDGPLDADGHQPLVKRIFKHAEAKDDRELMAWFMVAFDRLHRREKRVVRSWDWKARTMTEEEKLISPGDGIRGVPPKVNRDKFRLQHPVPEGGKLFGAKTRYHLRRRAWRFFRRMGFQKPAEYVKEVSRALALYRDDDLRLGQNILDSWGLLNALFRHSPAVTFGPRMANVQKGRSLKELAPSPKFPKLWKDAAAAPALLALVATAQSRLVRVWSMRWLRDHHADRLSGLQPDDLLRLLDHADDEVQRFGAELLAKAKDLDKLTIESWLRLLRTRNVEALEVLADAWRKHVRPERLELEQALALACAAAAPVARLGLEVLRARGANAAERAALARLAGAECTALAAELAAFALERITPADAYDREVASAFLDSLHRGARQAAWAWLTGGGAPAAYADAELWARLVESPHDDLRLALIDLLAARAELPAGTGDLAPVWTSALLAVHRGGRQKGKAIRQLRAALEAHPERAETLVPVLAVAIRSVRGSESRAGLCAVVWLVEARPELAPLVKRVLPELDMNMGAA
jgi:hypothetical protein